MGADYQHQFDGMNYEYMLAKMQKGWSSNETPCGTGSQLSYVREVKAALKQIVHQYAIESVNDAGAGDMNWISGLPLPLYRGFDLVVRHKDVTQFDITRQVLPQADLIVCRHVLNHLSVKLACDALDNFMASGSRYLVMTNCDNQVEYWRKFGVVMVEPVQTWPDCQKWRLELYRMGEDADSLYQMG